MKIEVGLIRLYYDIGQDVCQVLVIKFHLFYFDMVLLIELRDRKLYLFENVLKQMQLIRRIRHSNNFLQDLDSPRIWSLIGTNPFILETPQSFIIQLQLILDIKLINTQRRIFLKVKLHSLYLILKHRLDGLVNGCGYFFIIKEKPYDETRQGRFVKQLFSNYLPILQGIIDGHQFYHQVQKLFIIVDYLREGSLGGVDHLVIFQFDVRAKQFHTEPNNVFSKGIVLGNDLYQFR